MQNIENRSTFVTVLAWIFIVISGFATFITVIQNVMIRLMMSNMDVNIEEEMARNAGNVEVPGIAQFMINNMETVFLLFFLAALFMFIVSIALLKRKNWARIAFIIMMVLGIVGSIAGMVMQSSLQPDLGQFSDSQSAMQFESMMTFMTVAVYVINIAFTVLYAWIIKKLVSTDIKSEFMESMDVESA